MSDAGRRPTPLGILAALAVMAGCTGTDGQEPGRGFRERRVDVGSPTSDALALAVDGDSRMDIVLAGRDRVIIVTADGRGGFRVAGTAAAGENAVGLAAGDFDEDGRPDLVVANHETDHVTVLFAGADGYDRGRRAQVVVDVDPHPHAVRAADIDGDGHIDFLVDDRGHHRLKLYRGRGDGTFTADEAIAVGGDPYRGMAVADLDGDGDVDVATPNPRTVAVRLNDGTGRFAPGPELEVAGLRPFGVAIADVNGDGHADLGVGGGERQGTFAIWLGDGRGGFTLEPGSPRQIAEGPAKVRTADVDGDGLDDFLVASYVGDGVTVVFGGRSALRVVHLQVAGSPWGIAAGDFDGDGRTDLVTANDASDEISVLLAPHP